jgi:hypothetical protein
MTRLHLTLSALLLLVATGHALAGVSTYDPGHTAEEWRTLICGPDATAVWDQPPLDRAPSGTLHPPRLAPHGWIVPEALDRPVTHDREPQGGQRVPPPPVPLPGTLTLIAGALVGAALLLKSRKG